MGHWWVVLEKLHPCHQDSSDHVPIYARVAMADHGANVKKTKKKFKNLLDYLVPHLVFMISEGYQHAMWDLHNLYPLP